MLFEKLFFKEKTNPIRTFFSGLFAYMILCTAVAFFFRLDVFFYGIVSFLGLFFLLLERKRAKRSLGMLADSWRSFSIGSKLVFTVSVLFILMKSSTSPSILDNENLLRTNYKMAKRIWPCDRSGKPSSFLRTSILLAYPASRIQPSLRWQLFQRPEWLCACDRSLLFIHGMARPRSEHYRELPE